MPTFISLSAVSATNTSTTPFTHICKKPKLIPNFALILILSAVNGSTPIPEYEKTETNIVNTEVEEKEEVDNNTIILDNLDYNHSEDDEEKQEKLEEKLTEKSKEKEKSDGTDKDSDNSYRIFG